MMMDFGWDLMTIRTKVKQTEMDFEALKRCFESLTDEKRRLQKEVIGLRAMKVTTYGHQNNGSAFSSLSSSSSSSSSSSPSSWSRSRSSSRSEKDMAFPLITMCPSCKRVGASTSISTTASMAVAFSSDQKPPPPPPSPSPSPQKAEAAAAAASSSVNIRKQQHQQHLTLKYVPVSVQPPLLQPSRLGLSERLPFVYV